MRLNALRIKINGFKTNIMADFQVLGHISVIKYLPECILIYVDETKNGYRKSDGTIVDDKIYSWRCIFSGNEKKKNYVTKFFNRGMLVQVKGELLPYAIENGEMVDGYTVLVQTINRASYPRTTIKTEKKMIKESQEHVNEKPNLEEYENPDF